MTWILLMSSLILLGLGINVQYKRNVEFLINDEYEYTEKQRDDIADIVGVRIIILSILLSCMAICSMINYLLFAPFAFIFVTLLVMLIEVIHEFNRNIEEESKRQMIRVRVNNDKRKR